MLCEKVEFLVELNESLFISMGMDNFIRKLR